MDNNELLQAIYKELQDLKQTSLSTDNRLSNLETANVNISNDLQSMKADVFRLPHIEKNISLLMEGQQGMNEQFSKLDQVAEDVEEIKTKVTALEAVTKDNTSQIRELRVAK